MPLFPAFLVIFSLGLKESVVVLLASNSVVLHLFTADSSIKCCHNFQDAFQKLSQYTIKLYVGSTAYISLALFTCELSISTHPINRPQCLNITFIFTFRWMIWCIIL